MSLENEIYKDVARRVIILLFILSAFFGFEYILEFALLWAASIGIGAAISLLACLIFSR
jgi:hypothetical protein